MLSQSPILLSLIIPTRERCETLGSTLRTILKQPSEATEVIVSDNASQDQTRAVVEAFHDPRLRYVRTPRRVSMCDNFEFALAHAKGSYVMFIGDDDAVIAEGLLKLEALIRSGTSQIYFWWLHIYRPPMDGRPAEIELLSAKRPPTQVNLRELALFVVRWGGWRYWALPQPYHGAVARDALEKIRNHTGRVFHSTQPDVFLSAALPAVCDRALNVGESLTVQVHSVKSNGGAAALVTSANPRPKPWEQTLAEFGDYALHSTLLPNAPVRQNYISDAILRAVELFPEFYSHVRFDYTAMWAFGWRLGPETLRSILGKRKAIRARHDFRAGKFLFYCLVHRATKTVFELRKTRAIRSVSAFPPQTVEEFIRLVQPSSPAGT